MTSCAAFCKLRDKEPEDEPLLRQSRKYSWFIQWEESSRKAGRPFSLAGVIDCGFSDARRVLKIGMKLRPDERLQQPTCDERAVTISMTKRFVYFEWLRTQEYVDTRGDE